MPGVLSAAMMGFYGKLPSRGDFVGGGLSRGFVDGWERWIAGVLPLAQKRLGDEWNAAWLAAPAWRFTLPGGMLGPRPALGLCLPSVDRVGRCFPLVCAAEGLHADDDCLDAAEAAGRDALEHGRSPEELWQRLRNLPACATRGQSEGARWWTKGGPYVPKQELRLPHLPDAASFLAMVRA